MSRKWLYWFDEVGQDDKELVGKKCANLGEMTKLGLRVPKGFACLVPMHEDFLNLSGAMQEIKDYLGKLGDAPKSINQFDEMSHEIRKIIESKDFPKDMKEQILSYYKELSKKCGTHDVAVSTRSAGPVSHPGQYETYLNVKGEKDLLEKIKKVISSSFNPRSLAFRDQKKMPLEHDPIGVAVLQMVPARAAGILFTADPNTGDTSKMIIEANWGLGESVVSGELMPDEFIVNKETLEVINKKLGKKSNFIPIRKESGVAVSQTSDEMSSTFCIGDDEIKEIGRIGILLEKHFGYPQDIEWATDQTLNLPESIILLQTRNEVIAQKKSAVDHVLDMMIGGFGT